MKKSLLLFLCLIAINFQARSQAEYASTVSDQVVQGPCYIFATLAALESKILESNPSISSTLDLYEWNLYSIDVLGARSGDGHNMVQKVLAHAKNKGVYTRANNFVPTNNDGLPNVNDGLVPGIADFDCSDDFANGNIAYQRNPFEGACLDDDNKKFEIGPIEGNKYSYSHSGSGFVRDTTPTVAEMKARLDEGKGLIAFFSDWDNTTTAHAVFIHGYSGNTWYYKNSWPGNAGANQSGTLNIANCSDYYYLTGSMSADTGASCSASISGPTGTITQYGTYMLQSNGTPVSGISWSMSSNLSVVTQNSNAITVWANNCSSEPGYIMATYTSNGASCSESVSMTVNGPSSQTPTSISVLSLDWNNGNTCPGTTLELHANDNNPGYPLTTYDWSIAGASIISGQGTPTLYVQTPPGLGTTYLTFKVRAKKGNCSYSGWRTIYGQSDPANCGGGGFLFSSNNQNISVENLNNLDFEPNQMKYEVITIDGKIMNQGFIERDKTIIDITGLRQKIIILRVYDPVTGFYQSEKYFIK